MRKPSAVMCCLLLYPAFALGSDDLAGAAVTAIGGATVANPRDTAALLANPAALAIEERYDVQAHGRLSARGYELAASARDSGTLLALGASYKRLEATLPYRPEELPGWVADGELPPNRKRWHEVSLGGAYAFLDRKLTVGVGGFVSAYQHDRLGDGFTGNVELGVAARPHETTTLGLALRNPLPVRKQPESPFGVVFGARVGGDDVGYLGLDLGWTFEDVLGDPLVVRAGGELIAGPVRVRAGFRHEGAADAQAITWGLGTENEAGGIEYAMAIPVGGPLSLGEITHTLGVRLYVPEALAPPK